jgi:hypothetical protein
MMVDFCKYLIAELIGEVKEDIVCGLSFSETPPADEESPAPKILLFSAEPALKNNATY